ncbi:MAG: glycosyltransferase family 39 protein [Acidobacteria bacterium]|nr:glycosyltransferase family 39 protein [Acidobacteriota bacterium]
MAVLLCELLSRPYAEMGISDDLAYIVSAHNLALTGHLHYVGAAAAMLAAQLYVGAAFIKVFGFSFTIVRMATLLFSMLSAFFLQRCMVRSGLTEWNATFGTLALVLSPLFLILSVTYMSDIYGVFAVVICFYCCLRTLQAASTMASIGWLFAAVAANAVFGTARQVAWLGILVMVPCTLWLMRRNRRLMLAGALFTLAGTTFVFCCMAWYKHQLYSLPVPLGGGSLELAHTLGQLTHLFLDIPFLLLPVFVLFIPQIRHSSKRGFAIIAFVCAGYFLLALHWRISHPDFLLEPTEGALGGWVGLHGIHEGTHLQGNPPLLLTTPLQIVLTALCVAGVIGVCVFLARKHPTQSQRLSGYDMRWRDLIVLLGPFSIAYTVLLFPSATNVLFDRYALELLLVLSLCLGRLYQDYVQTRIPGPAIIVLAAMVLLGVGLTHNTFALYRARLLLINEIHSAGVPDTAVDNGWEYNFEVELEHSDHINDPGIRVPDHAYIPERSTDTGVCPSFVMGKTPHIHPIYGVSYSPNACYGPAPFAPVHYSRWLASSPGTLYVVKYLPPDAPQYRH